MPVINAAALPTGNLKGAEYGATISLILDHSEPGEGPRLHKHPYDETWVVIDGEINFPSRRGAVRGGARRHRDRPSEHAPQVHQPRPGRAHLVCIHANPTFETEWLE